jgi:hypothetical protein
MPMPVSRPEAVERRLARQWLALALGVLALAGLFALMVVVARMPPLDRLVTDPLFFKRCLVGHVNMALVAWFYSFVAALLLLLPSRHAPGRVARGAVFVAFAGVLAMLLGAGAPEAQPLLSNYIPTIDHWLFKTGQVLFGVGVLASFVDRRLLPGGEVREAVLDLPGAARAGLWAAAAALLLATLTFAVAWSSQPAGLEPEAYYELLFWGGGHVLQLVCVAAMVAVWIALLSSALGTSPVSPQAGTLLFGALVLPWGVAPLLALEGSWSSAYRVGFTGLMRWGIFPVVSIFLALCLSALWRARREGRIRTRDLADPRISAFVVSAGLTLLGFVLGAVIRGSNTMVPAHYHASVGGVTVAFMAVTYLLLPAFGLSEPSGRLRRLAGWQPALYGAGMLLFAAGFGLAGAYGMGRKIYGAEQAARGAVETFGLSLMGVGGFVSAAGGLLFLAVVLAAWRRRGAELPRQLENELRASSWRWRYGAQ